MMNLTSTPLTMHELIINTLPVILLAVLVGLGLILKQNLMLKLFAVFGKCITILATGAKPSRPDLYLLGKNPAVRTQLETQKFIIDFPETVKQWENVVMIQCVGSRIPENPNCSRICCQNAVKNALAILAVNGHHWLVRALSASYERAPVGELPIGGSLPSLVIEFFTQLFGAGIAFAAPVLVLLFTVSVLIGVLARAVPHINVLEFGFSLRIVTGIAGLAIFAPALEPAFGKLLEHFMHGLEAGLDALGT